jgi:hypothetical protein
MVEEIINKHISPAGVSHILRVLYPELQAKIRKYYYRDFFLHGIMKGKKGENEVGEKRIL